METIEVCGVKLQKQSCRLLKSGRPEWELVDDSESPSGKSYIARGQEPRIQVRKQPIKRTFAYRNGKAVEITGENIVLGHARYPLIRMSSKDWNKPR